MGETNSPSVAHVGYDITPLSRVEKYHNPRATEGESIDPSLKSFSLHNAISKHNMKN